MLAGIVRGETFQLNDGRAVTGDVVQGSANSEGVQIREGDNYERIPWVNFSQDDLKKFAEDKRMARFAEPNIELPPAERVKPPAVKLNSPPERLNRPPKYSLLAAMLSSSAGLVVLLVLYAANLFAAYEVSLFRAQPQALVCGLAAIPLIGFLSPIIFLAMPSRVAPPEETEPEAEPVPAPFGRPMETAPQAPVVSVQPIAAKAETSSLRLTSEKPGDTGRLPSTQVFQRGAFTFNRRFFETRFPGFFGIVRPDSDKDLVFLIKSSSGDFVVQRITRIAANDLHAEVVGGGASAEMMFPFAEIREVQLKHKDA